MNALAMSASSLNHWVRKAKARLVVDQRGVAVIELAIILPFMLLLYLGGLEVSQAMAVKRKAALTASTVANLAAQYSSISTSQTMPDILNAAAAVLTPYSAANAIVVVSAVNIDGAGHATVAWSEALNGAARPTGQAVTIPAGLDVPNTTLIWGETIYNYQPFIDFLNTGAFKLYSSIYMLPRLSSTITLAP